MTIPVSNPKFQAFDSLGAPLTGGLVYTYEPGTTTAKTTYTDAALTTPNANPIVLDARGECDLYIDNATKMLLKTATDVTIWTIDSVYPSNNKTLGYFVSSYDDLDAAITAIGATETTLYIDADCTLDEDQSLTQSSTLQIVFLIGYTVDGQAGASTETLTLNGPIEYGNWNPFGANITVVNPKIGTLADDATPSVKFRDKWITGGTTTITDFDDGVEGQEITIFAEHAITITDGTNIFLSGSANFVMSDTDSLTLVQKADGLWYETGRGDNGA